MIHTNKQQNNAGRRAGLVLALAVLISAATLATGPIRESSAQADAPSWSYTGGRLNWGNTGQTATLLPDGKVLIVVRFSEVELYDPSTKTWSANGTLKVLREGCTATLLGNGKVLVAGGSEIISDEERPLTNTAELYDPATGESRFTGNSKGPSKV